MRARLLNRLASLRRRLRSRYGRHAAAPGNGRRVAAERTARGVADYWTRYNVTLHRRFGSAEESLAYLRWRNDQYDGYGELMPVAGQDGRVVLDFGCGPGHDLIGFATSSKPARLIGIDVSPSSLAEAEARLRLHNAACELVHLDAAATELPLPTGCVDYVHSSGVLHHLPDPLSWLREFRRVLRRGGEARIMVYNHDSVWMHLLVAYMKRVLEKAFLDLSLEEAFARTTDGEDCPIAEVYRPEEFLALAGEAGFEAHFAGAAVSMQEARIMPYRWDAIQDRATPEPSRRFLLELNIDDRGLPRYRGHGAGIDGCFRLRLRPEPAASAVPR